MHCAGQTNTFLIIIGIFLRDVESRKEFTTQQRSGKNGSL